METPKISEAGQETLCAGKYIGRIITRRIDLKDEDREFFGVLKHGVDNGDFAIIQALADLESQQQYIDHSFGGVHADRAYDRTLAQQVTAMRLGVELGRLQD